MKKTIAMKLKSKDIVAYILLAIGSLLFLVLFILKLVDIINVSWLDIFMGFVIVASMFLFWNDAKKNER